MKDEFLYRFLAYYNRLNGLFELKTYLRVVRTRTDSLNSIETFFRLRANFILNDFFWLLYDASLLIKLLVVL